MPDDDRHGDHGDADQQRQPRAVDEPRKDVAADGVGAQRIRPRAARLPGGRLQEHRVVGEIGRIRRDAPVANIATSMITTMKIRPATAPWLALK